MALMARKLVVVPTNGAGAGGATSGLLDGWLAHIITRQAATIAITDERGEPIIAATAFAAGDRISPRAPVHGADGAVIAGGYTPIALQGEALTFAITAAALSSSVTLEITMVP